MAAMLRDQLQEQLRQYGLISADDGGGTAGGTDDDARPPERGGALEARMSKRVSFRLQSGGSRHAARWASEGKSSILPPSLPALSSRPTLLHH